MVRNAFVDRHVRSTVPQRNPFDRTVRTPDRKAMDDSGFERYVCIRARESDVDVVRLAELFGAAFAEPELEKCVPFGRDGTPTIASRVLEEPSLRPQDDIERTRERAGLRALRKVGT